MKTTYAHRLIKYTLGKVLSCVGKYEVSRRLRVVQKMQTQAQPPLLPTQQKRRRRRFGKKQSMKKGMCIIITQRQERRAGRSRRKERRQQQLWHNHPLPTIQQM
eukprot:PhF_6_TR24781/c0_g2_i3/m.34049